eukprot:GEMP01058467.1.p1 GENE.GEMP01058467.1~~GEMP01058467.1.p1  ORF type:complete len:101 (-),score=2.44 GEMP01058467.1:156-458(-)
MISHKKKRHSEFEFIWWSEHNSLCKLWYDPHELTPPDNLELFKIIFLCIDGRKVAYFGGTAKRSPIFWDSRKVAYFVGPLLFTYSKKVSCDEKGGFFPTT